MTAANGAHTTDRRREERRETSVDSTFTVEGKPRACTVMNVSGSGALLKFDGHRHLWLSDGDVGKVGMVVLQAGRTHSARIVRILFDGDVQVVALSLVE